MATEMKQARAFKAVPLESFSTAEQAVLRQAGKVRRGADNKPYVLAPFVKSYPVEEPAQAPAAPVQAETETE